MGDRLTSRIRRSGVLTDFCFAWIMEGPGNHGSMSPMMIGNSRARKAAKKRGLSDLRSKVMEVPLIERSVLMPAISKMAVSNQLSVLSSRRSVNDRNAGCDDLADN